MKPGDRVIDGGKLHLILEMSDEVGIPEGRPYCTLQCLHEGGPCRGVGHMRHTNICTGQDKKGRCIQWIVRRDWFAYWVSVNLLTPAPMT